MIWLRDVYLSKSKYFQQNLNLVEIFMSLIYKYRRWCSNLLYLFNVHLKSPKFETVSFNSIYRVTTSIKIRR